MTDQVTVRSPAITRAHWFGSSATPVIGWLSTSSKSDGKSGIVVLPSIGYEYLTAHRALRTLAEDLALSGHTVLRLDYHGTGDSAGNQWDADLLATWKENVRSSVRELRNAGVESVTLVGLRLGATLALLTAQEVGADAVVAWIPVVSGRRYVKELLLMSAVAPENVAAIGGVGTRFLAGCVFTAELLADLAAISTDDVQTGARVLILDRDDKTQNTKLAEQLGNAGATVQHLSLGGADQMLDLPTEYATAPAGQVRAIVDWLRPASLRTASGILPATKPQVQLAIDGVTITESAVCLGEHRLVAIESRPQDVSNATTVVFLNSGSEFHVGPGRAWVELSRQLAAGGHIAIRVDFRGWGESPDGGFAPGRPYDPHVVQDTQSIVAALRERGDRRIVLTGICAGIWVALYKGGQLPVDGIVAFNPQLYWQPGDPVFATLAEDRAWRVTEAKRKPEWVAAVAIIAEKWFAEISRFAFPVDFWFAQGDDGMLFIRGPLGHTGAAPIQAGSLAIHQLPGLDHAMHRHWCRAEAFDAISSMLQRIATR